MNMTTYLDGTQIIQTPQYLPSPDQVLRYVEEMRRRFAFLLNAIGEKVLFYARKWTGERCPNWDDVRLQCSRDCPICFGTGYVQGYTGPQEIMVSLISPTTGKVTIFEYGLRREFTPRCWTLHEPRIQNRDFFVRADGTRFWIDNATVTRIRGIELRQLFDMTEIERDHPIYRVR